MSVPLAIFEKLPADKLAGKVVLDQTNYYPGMGGFRRADLDKGELTSSELMQRHLSGATLIKGLHNLSWIHMESNARPGNIGGRLARAWAAAGHDLVIAKDGEDRKIAPLLAELGERARLGTIREAAEFGEIVLFSVYWPRIDAIVEEVGDALDGKTVIETMNPLGVTAEFVHFHDLGFMRDSSAAEALQSRLPKARIVKSFNLLAAPLLEAAAWSKSSVQPNVFYVSDDAAAGRVTRDLIADAGFKPINAGPLKGARQLEQAGVLLHHIVDHEYGGNADYLVRLGLSVIKASPGPVVRERIV